MRGSSRRRQDPFGRALLEDHAVVEEADPVGDVAGEAHLVRGDHHRHPAGGELADHLSTSATSSGSSALVTSSSSISSGLHRERAHDRDALLLPAGEPVGVVVAPARREPEALEQLARLSLGLARGRLPEHASARA